jgi:hypothetical protein
VLTLNQVCGFKFQVFTGSPIHPSSRCSQRGARWSGPAPAIVGAGAAEGGARGGGGKAHAGGRATAGRAQGGRRWWHAGGDSGVSSGGGARLK